MDKKAVIENFKEIPGVGKSIAEDFWQLGLRDIKDLRGQSAEQLYDRLCELQKCKVDRCLLYVIRCAIYYASNDTYEENLLKWWNWKD